MAAASFYAKIICPVVAPMHKVYVRLVGSIRTIFVRLRTKNRAKQRKYRQRLGEW